MWAWLGLHHETEFDQTERHIEAFVTTSTYDWKKYLVDMVPSKSNEQCWPDRKGNEEISKGKSDGVVCLWQPEWVDGSTKLKVGSIKAGVGLLEVLLPTICF